MPLNLSYYENKKVRLTFCLEKLKQASLSTNPEFNEMFDVVHIDEKWFYQTKESERYYLLPEESDPIRTCKSKRFITKVMFLEAVARPRFDDDNNTQFDGLPFKSNQYVQSLFKNNQFFFEFSKLTSLINLKTGDPSRRRFPSLDAPPKGNPC